MPTKYQYTDAQTGRTITFDWDRPTPPTEADIAQQFTLQSTPESPFSMDNISKSWDMFKALASGDAQGVGQQMQEQNAPQPMPTEAPLPPRDKSLLERGSDLAITPLVPESVRQTAGSAVGGYENLPIKYQGIGDTITGMYEGAKYLFSPFTDPRERASAMRGAAGGAVEGALTQTSPLDVLSLGTLKYLKQPIKTGARIASAVGSGVVSAGGAEQAADSERPIGERLAGAGKMALGALGVLGAAAPRTVAQDTPNNVAMQQLLEKQKLLSDPNYKPPVAPTDYVPGQGNLRTKLLDNLNPVANFVRQSGTNPVGAEDPYQLARLASAGGRANASLNAHDFRKVVDEAVAMGEGPILDAYLNYRGMLHAVEKIASTDKGWEKIKAGTALPEGFTHKTAAQGLKDLEAQIGPDRFAKVEALGEQIFSKLEMNLANLANEGMISQPWLQNIAKFGKGYIPQIKIIKHLVNKLDFAFGGSLDPVTGKFLKKIAGSEKTTKPPVEAALEALNKSEWMIQQNRVTTALWELREKNPNNPMLQNFVVPLFKVTKNGKVVEKGQLPQDFVKLHFFRDGQKYTFAVPDEVGTALQMAGNTAPQNVLGGVFNNFNRFMRATMTTYNIGFNAANPFRDSQDLRQLIPGPQQGLNPVARAKFYAGHVKELARQGHNMLKGQSTLDDPEYRELIKMGAGFSTGQSHIRLPEEYQNSFFWKHIADVANRIEITSKIRANRMLKAQGVPEVERAIKIREMGGSPDFGKYGTEQLSKFLFTFFNARMQGIDRNIQHLAANPGKGGLNVAKKLIKPAAFFYTINRLNQTVVDEDGIKAVDKQHPAVRANNFVMATPLEYVNSEGKKVHYVFTMPMGHYNQLTQSLSNLATETIGATNDSSVVQAGADVATNLLPLGNRLDTGGGANDFVKSLAAGAGASLQPALRIPLEWSLGYDLGLGRNAMPRALEGLPTDLQYTGTTSPTAKGIADIANAVTPFQLSPAQIEGSVLKKLPGVLDTGVKLSDRMIRGEGSKDFQTEAQKINSSIFGPVTSRFLRGEGTAVKSSAYDKFFGELDKSTKVNNAASLAKKENRLDLVDAILNDPAKMAALEKQPILMKQAEKLSEIRSAKRKAQQEIDSLGTAEAYAIFQQLNAEETELLYALSEFLGAGDPRHKPLTKFDQRREQIERLAKKLMK